MGPIQGSINQSLDTLGRVATVAFSPKRLAQAQAKEQAAQERKSLESQYQTINKLLETARKSAEEGVDTAKQVEFSKNIKDADYPELLKRREALESAVEAYANIEELQKTQKDTALRLGEDYYKGTLDNIRQDKRLKEAISSGQQSLKHDTEYIRRTKSFQAMQASQSAIVQKRQHAYALADMKKSIMKEDN